MSGERAREPFSITIPKINKTITIDPFGNPIGGSDNPGASLADIYDMHYIQNNEIPPHNKLHFLASVTILRKRQSIKSKTRRKKCRCKK